MIDVEAHVEGFLNLFLRFAFVIDLAFSGFGTTHLECHVIRTSKLSDVRLQEFCCTCKIAAAGPIVYKTGFKVGL